MPTQLDVAREALAQIGTRSKIASLTDGSAEAQYVNLLYGPIRDFLLREGDYDWSMVGRPLVPAPALAPSPPWDFAYEYPTDALRIRQIVPSNVPTNDPRPVEWTVASVITEPALVVVRFIFTQQASGTVLLTRSVPEELWDAMFQQSFVRLLASALAFALENRIEASKQKMEEAMSFAGIANLRDA